MTNAVPKDSGADVRGSHWTIDPYGVKAPGSDVWNGSAVTDWADNSGHGNTLIRESTSPTYNANGLATGRPSLSCGGSAGWRTAPGLALPTGSVLWAMTLYKLTTQSDYYRVFSASSASGSDVFGGVIPIIDSTDGAGGHRASYFYSFAEAHIYFTTGSFGLVQGVPTSLTAATMLLNEVSGGESATIDMSAISTDRVGLGVTAHAGSEGAYMEAVEHHWGVGILTATQREFIASCVLWNNDQQALLPSGSTFASARPVVGSSTTDAAGVSAAAGAAAAVGAANRAVQGSSAAVGSASGVGASNRAATASAAAIAAAAAVGLALAGGAGGAAGVSTATGVGAKIVAAVGSSAGTTGSTATGQTLAQAAGSSASTSAVSGVGAKTAQAAGSASAASAAVGASGSSAAAAVGASAGSSSATAAAASIVSAVGSSAAASSASATGAATRAATGAAAATASVAGQGAATASAAGAAAGASLAQGSSTASAVRSGDGAAGATSSVAGVGAAIISAVGQSAAISSAQASAVSISSGVGASSASGAAAATGRWMAAGIGVATGQGVGAGRATWAAQSVGAATGLSYCFGVGYVVPSFTSPTPADRVAHPGRELRVAIVIAPSRTAIAKG